MLKDFNREDLISMKIALHADLNRFTDDEIRNAAETSHIRKVARLFRRCQNVLHGSHEMYDLDANNKCALYRLDHGVRR